MEAMQTLTVGQSQAVLVLQQLVLALLVLLDARHSMNSELQRVWEM